MIFKRYLLRDMISFHQVFQDIVVEKLTITTFDINNVNNLNNQEKY
jgi:hypothetical protein